jgi:hypothetical protein
MKHRYLFPILLLGLAACETTPPPPPPVEMAQEGFDAAFLRAETNGSPVAADRDLTTLLARSDLNDDQRAKALHLRAMKRWRGGVNKPGAVTDFEAFLKLRPLDAKASEARRNQGFARNEIRGHESRLRQLQPLPTWFDEKVALGGLSEAAMRYKTSRLTPTERQIYTLREGQYICVNTSGGQAVHNYGPVPSYASGLVWCGL